MIPQDAGKYGEHLASEYLIKKNFNILTKNYKTKFGEIDIVCEQNDEIIFVEVKTRSSSKFAEAREFVTQTKMDKIIQAAHIYFQKEMRGKQKAYRLDVIEVYLKKDDTITIHHLQNVTL